MQRHPVDLIITDAWDAMGGATAPVIRSILGGRQWPPVVAYVDGTPESVRHVLSLAHAGARAVVLLGNGDSVLCLRELEGSSAVDAVAAEVSTAAASVVGPSILPLVLYCLANATGSSDAVAVSHALGHQRRVLSGYAARAGFRGIRDVRGACRVLVAVGVLLRTRYTVERTAHLVGYGSTAAFHNALRRRTGCCARELVTRCDLSYWTEHLLVRR
jgi:hypothetical protein